MQFLTESGINTIKMKIRCRSFAVAVMLLSFVVKLCDCISAEDTVNQYQDIVKQWQPQGRKLPQTNPPRLVPAEELSTPAYDPIKLLQSVETDPQASMPHELEAFLAEIELRRNPDIAEQAAEWNHDENDQQRQRSSVQELLTGVCESTDCPHNPLCCAVCGGTCETIWDHLNGVPNRALAEVALFLYQDLNVRPRKLNSEQDK